jgi:hypothetical protein
VAVVFAEEVRDMGGASRPGVPGMFPSFFGIGESFLADSDDGTRPAYVSLSYFVYWVDRPLPEPVLLIDSPPAFSDVLPGTGDGAFDFEAPTFRICARTWES